MDEHNTELTPEELAELQKKAHAFDSERGRLEKAQKELEALKANEAQLQQQLEAQQQAARDAAAGEAIDPKAAEIFGADGVEALKSMFAPVIAKLDSVGQKISERDTVEEQNRLRKAFQSKLNTKLSENNLPGFAPRIYNGDLSPTWSAFVESHPAVKRAQDEGDIETVSDMVNIFINQNKELVAGGGYAPNAVSGSIPVVKPDYTDRDYLRDKRELTKQLENLVITETEFNKKHGELFSRYVTAQEKAEQATQSYGLV